MIKIGFLPEVVTEGPNEFTGIKISTLLDQIDDLPENYNISVKTSDGWIVEYNMSETEGNLDIYNESGVVINNTGATMMLAYKMNGENLIEGEGPLRIIYCHDEFYTPSLYWTRLVISIEVIELSLIVLAFPFLLKYLLNTSEFLLKILSPSSVPTHNSFPELSSEMDVIMLLLLDFELFFRFLKILVSPESLKYFTSPELVPIHKIFSSSS